jgi:hypothetical protein
MNYSVRSDLKEGHTFRTDIEEAIGACALRMDGYRYMERVHPELCQASFPDFAPLVGPVVETLTFHPDLNDNFAVFFWLQRSFRMGGEHLTKYCPDHIAYDHLFLALYRHEIAEEFASIEYNRVWQLEYLPRAEMVAAYVRNSFCRIGNGPASSGDFGMTSSPPQLRH